MTVPAVAELPGIDRRAKLSKKDFDREYMMAHRPVVITDALHHWKAFGRWTPSFFREKFGDRLVEIDHKKRPLGPFIDDVLNSSSERPAPYFHNAELKPLFPEIADEIMPLPKYLLPNWLNGEFGAMGTEYLHRAGEPELYIGGTGRSFPVLHWDYEHTHAFLMQLFGQKRYFLYAPDQTPFVYPDPHEPKLSRVDNVERPDLARFPLFAQVKGYSFTLDPGEALFIPGGWWHTVRILTASITVSVNVANRSNWKLLSEDLGRHRGRKDKLKLNAYLGAIAAKNRLVELFS